jgi:dimethylhistidine N-methyltransferase
MNTLASLPGLYEPVTLEEIRRGLLDDPKRLPAACLYDDVGSALFEAITWLPEYGLTRADLRLLAKHAREVRDVVPGPLDAVELGSGSGRKARVLLESWDGPIRYQPVDLSATALKDCEDRLASLNGVVVLPLEAGYLEGLDRAVRRRRPEATVLVLFLGSNLGNFERPVAAAFLREVRAQLRPGDALLLSVDLEKSAERLLAAYDDPTGVTAAFNRNALSHLNRELAADFDVAAYRHRVVYDASARRVEMHLVPGSEQVVNVGALRLRLRVAAGEGIRTESSHKFVPAEVASWGEAAGFRRAAEWTDSEWAYGLSLLVVP